MTVKELKSILELCPDDAPVVFDTLDFGLWGINRGATQKEVYARMFYPHSYYEVPQGSHVVPIEAVILRP